MVFPFDGVFVDRSTCEDLDNPMTWVYMMFSELERWLRRKDSKEILSDELLGNVTEEGHKCELLVKELFDVPCQAGLYTLKFHMLDPVIEDMDRFGSLELLNSCAFERFKVQIKRAYRSMSQRPGSALEENVRFVEATGQDIREGLLLREMKSRGLW